MIYLVLDHLRDQWHLVRRRWARRLSRLAGNVLPPRRWGVFRFNEVGWDPVLVGRFRLYWRAEQWADRRQRYDNAGQERLRVILLEDYA